MSEKESAGTSTSTSTSTSNIIDGKEIAKSIRGEVAEQVEFLKQEYDGLVPGLAVVLVGHRKDSSTYVRMKRKAADECGFHSIDIWRDEDISEEDLLRCVDELNQDENIHAILVQLPLPAHIDEAKVLRRISIEKDCDGFSAENIGNLALRGGHPPLAVPCTPAGCIELLQRSGVDCTGKHAVVVGRSNIVGMPVSLLLLSMDCTVTVCHSKTQDISAEVSRADIVIAAAGKPEMIKGDWIRPGAVVIDVGINPVEDSSKKNGYRLVGDVEFATASQRASKITPVPGGVGPMTIAMLMRNTLNLARHSKGLPRIPLRTSKGAPGAAAEAGASQSQSQAQSSVSKTSSTGLLASSSSNTLSSSSSSLSTTRSLATPTSASPLKSRIVSGPQQMLSARGRSIPFLVFGLANVALGFAIGARYGRHFFQRQN